MKKIIIAMSLMIIGSFGASVTLPNTYLSKYEFYDKVKILKFNPR